MRYSGRRSKRDTLIENKAALDYYAAISGQPTPPSMDFEIPTSIRRRSPSGNRLGTPLERDVLKAVWKYLAMHPKVAWITRMNSGTAMADFGHGNTHPIYFNRKKGMSDLLGQMKDGRLIAVECKREGVSLQPHQREFLNEVLANNGVAFVARSVEDAIDALAHI